MSRSPSDQEEPLRTAVIVEDDPDIRHLMVEVLEAAGFSTVSVGNGIDGFRAIVAFNPEVATMDVNMPGIDGFEATRRIRAAGNDTYIIMVTGLEDEADVVLGLSSGADDYVVKPFRPRELRARIEAGLRSRTHRRRSGQLDMSSLETDSTNEDREKPQLPPQTSELSWGGLLIDPPTWTASVYGTPVRLTRTEFGILETLVRNAPNVVTFDAIGRALSDQADYRTLSSNGYRTHLANLRQKLGDDSREPHWIETVHGVGYKMVAARV